MSTNNTKFTLTEAIARLDDSYELIYVDYRDKLTDEQVEALVSGDYEKLWESFDEWEFESRWSGVGQVIDETFTSEEWESLSEDDQDAVRYEIETRDSSDWVTQLVRQTPDPLLRINCVSEDDAWSYEPVEPSEVLNAIGFDTNAENLAIVEAALLECSPEYSVLMGYWIVSVDLETLYKAQESDNVTITNPHLYLGNPFAGAGWITEKPLSGSFTIARSELRTDKAAFGYSVDEVYGELSASDFAATIEMQSNIN